MSIRIFGSAVARPVTTASYTIPATITSNTDLSVSPNVPMAAIPKVKNVTVTSTRTSYNDNPGVSSNQLKIFSTRSEYEALRSAAANTALAFGLNAVSAADQASTLQKKTFQTNANVTPIILDVVIIPK